MAACTTPKADRRPHRAVIGEGLRRAPAMVLVAILVALAATAAEPEGPSPRFAPEDHVVVVLTDRTAREYSPGMPPTRDDLESAREVWVWAPGIPPHRVDPGHPDTSAPSAGQSLAVDFPQPVGRSDSRAVERWIIAAPAAMWEAIPEAMLPTYPVVGQESEVRIPIDSKTPWRLRALTSEAGTWWLEVAPGAVRAAVQPVLTENRTFQVDDVQGHPLSGARVSILTDHPERGEVKKLADFRSDDDGLVTMPRLPGGREATLLIAADGHPPASLQGGPSSWPARIVVPPGTRLSGRFVTPDDTPSVGVKVRARAWISDDLPLPISLWEVSDENGRWTFSALPRRRVELFATVAGAAPWNTLLDLREEARDLGEIVLAPAQRVEVTVSDDVGSPIQGAEISIAGNPTPVTTDADGRAVLGVASGRPSHLAVSATDHLTRESTLQPPLPQSVPLTLPRAFIVRGRFVTSDGAGVSDGSVRIVEGTEFRPEELAPGGELSLDLESGTATTLELFSPHTPVLRIEIAPGQPGEVRDLGDLVAPSGLEVTGRLLRADTGEPVAGARLWVPRPTKSGPLVSWMLQDLVVTHSAVDGTFVLSGTEVLPFDLTIEATGLARSRVPVVPQTGSQRVELGDVELSTGAELEVRLDEGSETAHDGEAMATVDLGGRRLPADLLRAAVVEGVAHISEVPEGRYTVAVSRGGVMLCEASVEISRDDDDAEVVCHAHGIPVSGRVEIGGRTIGPGSLIWMEPPTEEPIPEGVMRFGSGALRQSHAFIPRRPDVRVEVDDDGTFRTDRLQPGAWDVLWLPPDGPSIGPRTIQVPSDTDGLDLVLSFPALLIEGRVVNEEGQPVSQARIRVLSGEAFAISKQDGSFALAGLSPGVYELQARAAAQVSRPVEVTLEADQPADPVTLVLAAPRSNLSVEVTSEDGGTTAGALVFMQEEGKPLRILTADADGRADASLQPPFSPRLRVAAYVGGRWAFGAWHDVQAGSERTELEVSFPRDAGSLVLSSTETSGEPVITTESGWSLTALQAWLGVPLQVSPSSPLTLTGLPPGRYEVSVGQRRGSTEVETRKTAELEID